MPSRNTVKQDVAESFYHVYARGSSKQPIFLDTADFEFFISLFARYLSDEPKKTPAGLEYPHYTGDVELVAFCLMGNHFHLLLYQVAESSMPSLMKSIMTSYSRHFNRKYKRTGSLFETRYKASRVDAESYLQHISRYIHLNPRYWKRYAYSSLRYYLNGDSPEWLIPDKITNMFKSGVDYLAFLKDYEDQKQILDELKYELADT